MGFVPLQQNFSSAGNNTTLLLDAYSSQLDVGGLVYACTLGITMPMIIVANLLTIIALIKVQISKAKRVVAPYFALSLAVSDLCIGVLLLPSNLVIFLANTGHTGDVSCDFHGYLSVTLFTTTLSNIVVISIDRYICVLQPIKYKSLVKPRRAFFMILFAWSYGLFCAAIPFATNARYRYNSGLRACFLDLGEGRNKEVTVILFIIDFSLPLTVILFTNLKIFRTARLRSRRIAEWHVNDPKVRHIGPPPSPSPRVFAISGHNLNLTQNTDTHNLEAASQAPSARPSANISLEKRLTRAILLILTVLILLVTPYHLLTAAMTIAGLNVDVALSRLNLTRLFSWMIYFNSLVNAGIYSYINTNFRRRLKEIACGKNSTDKITQERRNNTNALKSPPAQQQDEAEQRDGEASLNSDIFGQFSHVISRHTPTESLLANYTCSSVGESSTNSELCRGTRESGKERGVLRKQLSEILLPTHSRGTGSGQDAAEPSCKRTRSAWVRSETNLRRGSVRRERGKRLKAKSKRFRELEREMRKLETQFSSGTSSHIKTTD